MSVFPTQDGKRVYVPYAKRDTDAHWDVIVIGSGMAGMSCATALAKYGKRVLVLEKHYVPGGFTHSFTRKGFEWDAGVHAIGEMEGNKPPFKMLNWLTNERVKMISLGKDYDEFNYPGDFKIGFPDSKKEFIHRLKEQFPDETQKIDIYFEMCKKAAKQSMPYFPLKTFSKATDKFVSKLWHTMTKDWWQITTQEVLDEIGISTKLGTLLTAQWGYYGNIPTESSFAIHALTVLHFAYGAWYPEGGPKEFAANMLDQVLAVGGQVLCQAQVDQLLIENNKVVGVVMENGDKIYAPKVVAACPTKTTLGKLLPKEYRNQDWVQSILSVGQSPSYIGLNLGFDTDISKLGASPTNMWFNESWDQTSRGWDPRDPNSEAPILYVSFPSLKDPLHKNPNKHTGEVVTFIPWECVSSWQSSEYQHRDDNYANFKKNLEERLIKQLRKYIPEIMDAVTYYELSTPLTALHFTGAAHGSIYGLEATPKRFGNQDLRAETPLKGLYLSGVDMLSTGVVGAMSSGMLTAATIERRVLLKMI